MNVHMKTNVAAEVVLFNNKFQKSGNTAMLITESDNYMKVLIFVLFLCRDVLDSFISLLKDYTKEVSIRPSSRTDNRFSF